MPSSPIEQMDSSEQKDEKKELRRQLLALRETFPQKRRAVLDKELCRRMAAHPFFRDAEILLLYFPTRGEPNLLPLAKLALEQEKQLAFPVCHTNDVTMTFHTVSDLRELIPGHYGIHEPSLSAPQPTARENTLCILPGLAFDQKGYRLGYGKGYYDRFLTHFPGRKVGLLYHAFLSKRLPTEPTDQAVQLMITEKGEFMPNESFS
ncbi:MAG: 5-formyltetrahydrofolate cyclo-ligase [Clostridia bacterium]|nr:5-formyltetrahydrofolate cyclo-ligase [Clostridia bacterium]